MTDSPPDSPMRTARVFRVLAVRGGVLATLALGALVWGVFGIDAAHGVLLGGIAGTLGFWIMARRLEKFATVRPEKVQSAALTGTFLRLLLYGIVLYRAYTLDPETMRGLIGAVAGILVIRFVAVFMGVFGVGLPDTPRTTDENGTTSPPDDSRE